MVEMKLPKSFELMGRVFQVKIVPNLVNENDAVGEAKFRVDEVRLQKITESCPLTKDKQMQSYYHELVHHIICEMGYEFRNDNEEEKFVTLFSKLLYQGLKTAKY